MADIKTRGPEKRKGEVPLRQAAEEERVGRRFEGCERSWNWRSRSDGNLERSGTSDAVRDYREYGEAMKQGE
jgi:hypothetical protein